MTSYVQFCEQLCIPTKTAKQHNKPWFTKEIQQLRKDKNYAYKSGNKEDYMAAKYKLRSGIRKAKFNYASKIEQDISNNNTRTVWKKLQVLARSGD